jgi:hypothetical protein
MGRMDRLNRKYQDAARSLHDAIDKEDLTRLLGSKKVEGAVQSGDPKCGLVGGSRNRHGERGASARLCDLVEYLVAVDSRPSVRRPAGSDRIPRNREPFGRPRICFCQS